jgi:putative aldouronate transport system permease protein
MQIFKLKGGRCQMKPQIRVGALSRKFTVPNRVVQLGKDIIRDRYLLLLMLPVIAYYIIFHYVPMYGVTIAFKNFSAAKGILGSPWAGFKWFEQFFRSIYFSRIVRNTVLINVYGLLWGFPVPIIFALFLNELKDGVFRRSVQTISYLPHFISVVVVVGMIVNFLSPLDGIVNVALKAIGHEAINFMSEAKWFRTIYISSGIWQGFGWNSIIYLAAITSIDPTLYEAAEIDGASRLRKVWHITIPGILPTVIILLILNLGNIMSVGYEKIILMYSPATYETADVISTYVYRRGILNAEYSFGAAVGLFNSVINFLLIILVNRISKKITDIALW